MYSASIYRSRTGQSASIVMGLPSDKRDETGFLGEGTGRSPVKVLT